MTNTMLSQLKQRFYVELYESVLPFWMNHSLDHKNGGYFNCLDRDGSVWDTRKHVWLQGRQTWMLSKLYNSTLPQQETLDAATLGAEFLKRHARTPDDRVYFSLTAEGKPVFMQRKIFSECFYVMAMAEYARASKNPAYREEARSLFDSVIVYAKDSTLIGRPVYEGTTPMTSLAVPMILLNLIEEVNDPGETTYEELAQWCVQQMKLHVRPELQLVVEHVTPNGELLDTPEGRTVSPGHAIEAGWFLLDYARRKNLQDLIQTALDMIRWSLNFGWDTEYGGLYYFMDRDGYSPPALEWSMKLWWPHNEALIALVMAYKETRQEEWLAWLDRVAEYTFGLFPDPEHGEWYGYFDRQGVLTHRFKGAPYKGCFHVPRALFLCDQMLADEV